MMGRIVGVVVGEEDSEGVGEEAGAVGPGSDVALYDWARSLCLSVHDESSQQHVVIALAPDDGCYSPQSSLMYHDQS